MSRVLIVASAFAFVVPASLALAQSQSASDPTVLTRRGTDYRSNSHDWREDALAVAGIGRSKP